MASLYGTNYTLANITANGIIPAGDADGNVKVIYDEYVFTGGVIGLASTIELGAKLPASARVIDCRVNSTSLGGTGKLKFGFRATEDMDGETVAEDDNALIAELDASGGAAAADIYDSVNLAGLFAKYSLPTQAFATVTQASTATSGTIRFMLKYTID